MIIIGISGTAGSGKDTVADIIAQEFSAHIFNTSDYVRAVTRYIFDLPHESSPIRDQLYEVATELRKLNQASTVNMGIVQARERGFSAQLITGLRTVGEANAVRVNGGIIIGVDAEPSVRHGRIQKRARDAESERTLEQFIIQDEYENNGVGDGDMRGIRHIIAEADIVIENNSSLEELRTQIIKELTPLIKL